MRRCVGWLWLGVVLGCARAEAPPVADPTAIDGSPADAASGAALGIDEERLTRELDAYVAEFGKH